MLQLFLKHLLPDVFEDILNAVQQAVQAYP